jgi:hypothetical protein
MIYSALLWWAALFLLVLCAGFLILFVEDCFRPTDGQPEFRPRHLAQWEERNEIRKAQSASIRKGQ